jgi:hypothetical protein
MAANRDVLARLTSALQEAIAVIDNADQAYHIAVIPDDGPPVDVAFDNLEEAVAYIAEQRAALQLLQRDTPEAVRYIRIYRGKRLTLVKGPRWQLVDGDTSVTIAAPAVPDTDAFGTLSDALTRPVPTTAPAAAPASIPDGTSAHPVTMLGDDDDLASDDEPHISPE